MTRLLLCLAVLLMLPSLANAATQNVVLTWPDLPNETGYKIEKRVCGVGTYSPIGTTLAGVTTYTDVNVPQGTNAGYQVKGTNALGDGPPSDEVCIVSAGTPGKVGPVNATIQIVP